MQNKQLFFKIFGFTYISDFKTDKYDGVILFNDSFIGYLTYDNKVELENKTIYKSIEINKIKEDYIEGTVENINNEKIHYCFDTNNKAYLLKKGNSVVSFLDEIIIKEDIEFRNHLLNEFPIIMKNIEGRNNGFKRVF